MPMGYDLEEVDTVTKTDNSVELMQDPGGEYYVTSPGVRCGENTDVIVTEGDLAELLEVMLNGD